MKACKGWLLATACFCGAVLAQVPVPAGTAASAPAPIPAEAFYRQTELERFALSPSGRWLAIGFRATGRRTQLIVYDLEKSVALPAPVGFADADVDRFFWVNDDWLVFDIIDRTSGGGDQRFSAGLFSVRRDGSQRRQLVRLGYDVDIRRYGIEPLSAGHTLLHVPAGGGNEVVVGERRFTAGGDFEGVTAKRLNVITGSSTALSAGAPPFVLNWLFDPAGEPRAVVTRRQGRSAVHWRAPGSAEWRLLAEAAAFELPFWPSFVGSDGELYVTATDSRTGNHVLKRFDFASGRPETEAVVSTPGFDFAGAIVSETPGGKALGVRVTTDAETTVWFDPRLRRLQEETDLRLPGNVNSLYCRRCDSDNMTLLVFSYSDRDPGQLWVHTVADGRWRLMGPRRPGIDPQRMGRTEFERVPARDGLPIPLWLTHPAQAAPGPLPAVVLVHGGPWVRDREWEWRADAQFLASRGYLVIEPEFRGSTGYGDAHFRAGWRQWGRAMQDDLADALAWAVDKGLADPKRVCIAGASYGGYATLMGLARHPELYRCGVAWAAVTDPRLMFKWSRISDVWEEGRLYDLPRLIGDPVTDAAMIESVTPLLLADRMRAPLLLAFGGADRRVPIEHGLRMRDALVAVGRPPEWVLYRDEGHGWLKLETQLDFARRLEDFLARHLK